MTSRTVIEELARERLGFERLRPGQLRAVEALAGGRHVLAVLPTAGGKSAIYEPVATVSSPSPPSRSATLLVVPYTVSVRHLAGCAVYVSVRHVAGCAVSRRRWP